MSKIVHTDNNLWINEADKKPFPSSADEDADWQANGAPEGVIKNPNFGTVTEEDLPDPPKPEFKTLSGSEFIGLVSAAISMARLDQLLAKSETVKALLMKAEKIDRNSGNTPAALAYLKTVTNPLTDDEIAAIDKAWKALK